MQKCFEFLLIESHKNKSRKVRNKIFKLRYEKTLIMFVLVVISQYLHVVHFPSRHNTQNACVIHQNAVIKYHTTRTKSIKLNNL